MILKYIKSFFYSLLPLLETCLEELVKIIKNYKSYNQYLQFKVWLKQNGAYITMKQQIKFLSIDNRYFVASEYIKNGEILFQVPQRIMLNPYTEIIDSIFQSLKGIVDNDQLCIAVFLALEFKNRNSKLIHFLHFLPKDLNFFPLFFNSDEENLLSNSMVHSKCKMWKDQILDEYRQIMELKLYEFSLEEYIRCRHLVWSRNFNCYFNDKINYSSMVPFGDLYNYHPLKLNVMWYYDQDNKSFKIEALKEIKPGEEIFLCYGDHSNDELLFFYGFCIENNPILIEYKFNYKEKLVILRNPLELQNTVPFFRKSMIPHIKSLKLEKTALSKMKKELSKILSKYPSTLENDVVRYKLSKENNDFNSLNILIVLIEEKKLLHDYVNFLEKVMNILGQEKSVSIKNIDSLIYHDNCISFKYLKNLKEFIQNLQK